MAQHSSTGQGAIIEGEGVKESDWQSGSGTRMYTHTHTHGSGSGRKG